MGTKTILVTGGDGQLGKSLRDLAQSFAPSYQFIFTDVDTLDITDSDAIRKMVFENRVEIIINAAGYTAVDKAEQEVDKAFLLNETAVANLAGIAAEANAFFVHISTDYVFDGTSHTPYTVDMKPNPASVYGRSKLAGEVAVHAAQGHAAIIRTAWLYSPYGKNFVKTMLRLADSQPEIRVVNDQIGCPTLAADLAMAIMTVVENRSTIQKVETYHFANKGIISWFDFAEAIIELSGKPCKVSPIKTAEFAAPAPRPAYSVFDTTKIEHDYHLLIPNWRDSLQKVMPQIIHNFSNNIL